ncbi:hypothetical protein [Streptomyces sp. AP-93]|uniref:hypothetical protein n=1 Tax=Streptomyces sp. AP-93 TaxID=2929048 RepID=UPI001FAEB62F|nr:hypothetical protein [Streptomyces sp. AP-93]MCJ0875643.1 hypothetical protein [Streptomyces sp. AP-93]
MPPADRAALTARIAAMKAEPAFRELAVRLTPPTEEDGLRRGIRRVLAAVDGFDIE